LENDPYLFLINRNKQVGRHVHCTGDSEVVVPESMIALCPEPTTRLGSFLSKVGEIRDFKQSKGSPMVESLPYIG